VGVGVMMLLGSEGRACKHHQKECGDEKLFHAPNVTRGRCQR
jgi:hypothetical protein